MRISPHGALLAGLLLTAACSDRAREGVIRVGHFPNVTHAPAVVAHDRTRSGQGWFEARTGRQVEWFVYQAGPSAMEALIVGSIDLAYVGPGPALNAYLRSDGKDVRIVAGAVRGGSALVVKRGSGLRSAADFKQRRIATPQLGNTQDIACRAWLQRGGLQVTALGGDVAVVPTQNPDQLGVFRRGEVDAVWTVEPWVSRLVREADGEVLVDEREAVTTVLVASARFLAKHRDDVARFVRAHEELIAWLDHSRDEAIARTREELSRETARPIDAVLLADCWQRMRFSAEVEPAVLVALAEDAVRTGMLKQAADLGRLVERLP
jgi:NitT/TauT family transport system substrate-binding protein